MSLKRIRVTCESEEGDWKAQADGAGRAQARADTTAEVVKKTTRAARKRGDTSVIIHKPDGEIQDERTYPRSKDPHPPKG